jgi:hypothetical protein
VSEHGIEWGGCGRTPTEAEAEFVAVLDGLVPGLDYWLLGGDGEAAWLLVSSDFVVGDAVRDTLRLDFDPAGIRGGWSPAFLNWDGDVRADAAGIDTTGPDGIREPAAYRSPAELARVAADWFAAHRRQWPTSERAPGGGRRA